MFKNTYQRSSFRDSKIATDPSDGLDHLLRKYLPSLIRLGHSAKEVRTKILNICYFRRKSDRGPFEFKPILKYGCSETRPTRNQLRPLKLAEYHLIHNLPLAPLKVPLCFQPPKSRSVQNWMHCSNYGCKVCNAYEILIPSNLSTPVIPGNRVRILYLLHHGKDTNGEPNSKHLLINIANMNSSTLRYSTLPN
ncbi:hypothetical protein LOD99_11033 [Oopsacas minuta]|uniref:Uncharacterized protein n=1 Tax=Oopsacas minuta TaxID=111878 RepID=A0AAV7KCG2_9METZ|nr:hypothetical protein LOD99_11033 [Oopsacas minuta]